MLKALLGTKIGQSHSFTEEGRRIPVTLIQAGPCWVTQINDRGSYRSLQLGFGIAKHLSRAQEGSIKKAGLTIKPRFLREVRVSAVPAEQLSLGKEIKVAEIFKVGDKVRVSGTSKGKGFAGVVKRHGFAGGPRTHGQSDRERAPGSIGQTTTPGRVYKGKRMAGRMGHERVTVRGLKVVAVDAEHNLLTIKGLVPGAKQELLVISKE